jgi:hypothetical protein
MDSGQRGAALSTVQIDAPASGPERELHGLVLNDKADGMALGRVRLRIQLTAPNFHGGRSAEISSPFHQALVGIIIGASHPNPIAGHSSASTAPASRWREYWDETGRLLLPSLNLVHFTIILLKKSHYPGSEARLSRLETLRGLEFQLSSLARQVSQSPDPERFATNNLPPFPLQSSDSRFAGIR